MSQITSYQLQLHDFADLVEVYSGIVFSVKDTSDDGGKMLLFGFFALEVCLLCYAFLDGCLDRMNICNIVHLRLRSSDNMKLYWTGDSQ